MFVPICACRCSPPDLPCAPGLLWDPVNCVCVPEDGMSYSERETGKIVCDRVNSNVSCCWDVGQNIITRMC